MLIKNEKGIPRKITFISLLERNMFRRDRREEEPSCFGMNKIRFYMRCLIVYGVTRHLFEGVGF